MKLQQCWNTTPHQRYIYIPSLHLVRDYSNEDAVIESRPSNQCIDPLIIMTAVLDIHIVTLRNIVIILKQKSIESQYKKTTPVNITTRPAVALILMEYKSMKRNKSNKVHTILQHKYSISMNSKEK